MAAIKRLIDKRKQNEELVISVILGDIESVKSCLENGANVNTTKNEDQETPLCLAAKYYYPDVVSVLIIAGGDPNFTRNKDRRTPLHIASHKGYTEIASQLIEAGGDPNAANKDQKTPLHIAADKSHTEIVSLLIQAGGNPNATDNQGKTPLHRAAYYDHTDVVSLLIQAGGNPNATDNWEETPLHCAAYYGHTDVVTLLIQAGGNPNATNKKQLTPLQKAMLNNYTETASLLKEYRRDPSIYTKKRPLHWAAKNDKAALVEMLILAGEDPNIVDQDNNTSLHLACKHGHLDVIRCLVHHGASTTIKNSEGNIPLDECQDKDKYNIVDIFDSFKEIAYDTKDLETNDMVLITAVRNGDIEKARVALNKGANANAQNGGHSTPLHYAVRKGNTEIVSLLIEAGGDPNKANDDQETPLHVAVGFGYAKIVLLLIQAGGNPNAFAQSGNTLLHRACHYGYVDVIHYLLSEGADPTIENDNNETPLDLCQQNGDIVNIFAEYNPKRVLENVSEWNIESIDEGQVFEKSQYGIKLVIPPSSVEQGQEVETKVKLVSSEKSEFELPSDVEPVSCFYKIETTGKFSRPIELHLQHNVELTSQEETQQLAFITAKGPPPYKFELVPIEIDQKFKPNDNSGVVKVSDFSVFSIVKLKLKALFCREPSYSYAMTVFFKHMLKSSWAIQAVVTRNLGPFLKRVSTEKCFESWNKIEPVSFHFDPEVNELTSILVNDCFQIKPLKKPFKVTKKAVDRSQPDTALLYLKFKASLKPDENLTDLELAFKGMRDGESLVIASNELQAIQGKTDELAKLTTPYAIEHLQTSSRKEISMELLSKEPKKQHLMSLLHCIKHMWDTIGEQLAVRYGDIKSAEYNVAYDNTKKLSEVLQVWIDKRTCEVSWRTIITVIDDPPVENKKVADEICEFLARSDIQIEYLLTGCSFATFSAPPPIPPRQRINKPSIPPIPAKRKSKLSSETTPPPIPPVPKKRTRIPCVKKQEQELDEMEQEAPLQSSNPIGFAAHHLHKQAKQWEEKDNNMIVATKRMARLMMQMSKFARDEEGDVTSKDDFIQTANLIVKDSKEVVEIAAKVAIICTDKQLKSTLSQVIDGIPTYATQLKINVGVHARRRGDDPEADQEATRLLTVNAENLMTAVGVVLNTTESALIKVSPEAHAHLTGLSWVKKLN